MKRSFRRQVIVGFLVMVLLCISTVLLAFVTTRTMQNSFLSMMRDNVAALKAAEELELALLSQRGFLANYFLDGNPVWLKRLEEKKVNFSDWLTKASRTALTPAEKAIIEDIRLVYRNYENDRNQAKRLYETGRTQEAKSVLLKNMWESFELLYQKCEDFIAINESLIARSEDALRRRISGMMVLIATTAFIVIGSVGFMFYFLIRRILASVENIAVTTREISLKSLNGRVGTENLEEELEYLAKSINTMLDRLERSFDYIKEFSSSIGHELKSPLAIIKGGSEIALRKERQAEDYRQTLRVNIEEANRMISIVEDLVFLAKLDYNAENIKKEIFDCTPFLKDIGSRAQMLAAQKQISFSELIPECSIALQGNRLHLSRLFFNLIQNAVKFTPEGGKIGFTAHVESGVLKISISDTGPGISQEDLPRIFRRFFHKERSHPESSDSIGLGLSISKSIAQFHNGDIAVESVPGKGATFTVTLPIFTP